MFLLVLGSLGACGYFYTLLRQERVARAALEQQIAAFGPRFDQFKEAVRDVDRRLSATVFQEIDLGASGWQPIAGGLYVIDLQASAAGKGTKVSGRIINPTSVTHESAQISVRAGEHRGTFVRVVELPKGLVVPKGMEPPKSARTYMYKVKLSDGDVSMYFTPDPPAKAGAKTGGTPGPGSPR